MSYIGRSVNLNAQPESFYTNASNLISGTVPLARLSVANTVANGVVDITAQSFAGVKTFTSNVTFSGSRTFFASGSVLDWNSGDVTLTHSANTLTFGGASSGYIFNDGNVGIGVTPSDSDIRHLQFGTNAIISGSGNSYLSNNSVFKGAWKYVASSVATMQYSMTTNGHQFDYAAAGTAGGSITFTTALGINTSGHLGIAAGKRFYLDGVAGTGDTYLEEVAANEVRIVAAGNERLRAVGSNGIQITGALTVASGTPIYLDGSFSGDTYLYEVVANNIRVVAGGNNVASFGVAGGAGAEFFGSLIINNAQKFYLDGGSDTYILEPSANIMDFYVGGNHRVRILDQALASYGTTGIGFYAANGGTNTGTTVVHNSDGYLYRQSSSRRFKENISPAVVTDAQLDAFMATAPSWWDYKGQKNGALGFIAEDLAALPLDRYGCNPLVNYDGDGQVESNRDYALIAMHHLVIQRMQKEIDALKLQLSKRDV